MAKATTRKPVRLSTIYRSAEKDQQEGKWDKAALKYRQALKRKENLGTWGSLAWVLLQLEDYKEALTAAREMRSLAFSRHSRSYFALASTLIGLIHEQAGRRQLAEKYYREALEADASPETCVFLGYLLQRTDAPSEAKASFLQALRLDKNYIEAHYALARWYARHHDNDRALKHLNSILALNPEDAPALAQLGVLSWQFGSRGIHNAVTLLQRALENDPDSIENRIYLALTYKLLKKRKDAHFHFQNTLDEVGETASLHWTYAYFLWKDLKQHDNAEDHFKSAVALAPEDGATHLYFGIFLKDRGRTAEAKLHLRKALQLGKNAAEPLLADI